MQKLLLAAIASLGFAGCYTHGDVGMGATYSSGNGYYASGGGGYYANPQLYYYGPGVSVVAYSDDPVFYSDGYYWRYYGGTWYSSSYYGGGWTLAYNVPYGVRTIRQPTSYARFQPGQGWTRVNASGGAYTGGAPVVRDHRTGLPGARDIEHARPPQRPGLLAAGIVVEHARPSHVVASAQRARTRQRPDGSRPSQALIALAAKRCAGHVPAFSFSA
jgi:hypothetical protein